MHYSRKPTIKHNYNIATYKREPGELNWPSGSVLVPDFEEGVPGAGADRHPVLGHAEAGHAVVVAGQHACKGKRFQLQKKLTDVYFIQP